MIKFNRKSFSILKIPLKNFDSEMNEIIKLETKRQFDNLNLIASENYTSKAVLQALGSPMQNKYSEGQVGARYYGGTEFIDQMEQLCINRALSAFNLNKENWGVNVQCLSGSPANLYAYGAICDIGDSIVSMDLKYGGHLSHGFSIGEKKISFTSKYYNFYNYISQDFNKVDFDEIEEIVKNRKPKILIAGYSAFTKFLDYKKFQEIAHKYGAVLMADMSHISGLVSANLVHPNPFDFCDIVTTTTHKSLRGPRSSLIFFNKKCSIVNNLETKINESVFPGHQGGPHNHTISALAVALKFCKTDEYINYQKNVINNSKILAQRLIEKGIDVIGGGTDNHMVLLNLKKSKIDGGRIEHLCNKINISINKNILPGDKSAFVPSGIRLGTPAMTTRECNEKDFIKIADFFYRTIKLGKSYKLKEHKFKDFKNYVDNEMINDSNLLELKKEIKEFCNSKPFPYDLD